MNINILIIPENLKDFVRPKGDGIFYGIRLQPALNDFEIVSELMMTLPRDIQDILNVHGLADSMGFANRGLISNQILNDFMISLTENERAYLYSVGINTMLRIPFQGVYLWGNSYVDTHVIYDFDVRSHKYKPRGA